tara:strand:+ start:370 stop:549 length:180 start_codon:yes stop_codon:yes gene_type:complete
MKLTGMQSSHAIRTHIKSLKTSIDGSSNKRIVHEFIKHWKLKYAIALEDEMKIINLRMK